MVMKHAPDWPPSGPNRPSNRTGYASALASDVRRDAGDPVLSVANADETPDQPPIDYGLPQLLSCSEVAALFSRSPRTIRRWIQAGHLMPVRIGGALFFSVEDVRRVISGQLSASVLERQGHRQRASDAAGVAR
jgi:hypothetical protein